ncbi:hypothetical protein P9112_013010 [Eukaryota sp. TZLM1-RC]
MSSTVRVNHKYQLYTDFKDINDVVPGSFQNQAISAKLYDDELSYKRAVHLYQQLRSKYLVNMVDHFYDSSFGYYFIILERTGSTWTELTQTDPSFLNRHYSSTIRSLAATWLFIYSQNYGLVRFDPQLFTFKVGHGWRLAHTDSLVHHKQPNAEQFQCTQEAAERVIESQYVDITTDTTLPELLLACVFLEECTLNDDEKMEFIELMLMVVLSPEKVNDCKNDKIQRLFVLIARVVDNSQY